MLLLLTCMQPVTPRLVGQRIISNHVKPPKDQTQAICPTAATCSLVDRLIWWFSVQLVEGWQDARTWAAAASASAARQLNSLTAAFHSLYRSENKYRMMFLSILLSYCVQSKAASHTVMYKAALNSTKQSHHVKYRLHNRVGWGNTMSHLNKLTIFHARYHSLCWIVK